MSYSLPGRNLFKLIKSTWGDTVHATSHNLPYVYRCDGAGFRMGVFVKKKTASSDHDLSQAIASFRSGKLSDAEQCFKEVLRHQPKNIAALNLLSVLLSHQKRYIEAEVYIKAALEVNLSSDATFYNFGLILKALKRRNEALERFSQALSINATVAETWNNRGTVLNDLKRYDDAVVDFNKAIELQPNYSEALCNKGKSLTELKRYDEALAAYDKALSLKPDLAEAWIGRGNVFNRLNRHEEAAIAYAEVLKIDPQYPFMKGTLLYQKMLSCDWKGIEDLIAEINNDLAAGERSAEPFGYQAIARSAWDFKRCAEIYVADKFPRSEAPLWRGERYDNPKIRVGYLSGEFRHHVTLMLMTELFELHDKNHFELFAFDNGRDDESELRGRIKKAFNSIIDIRRLDDLQAATMVKQKQIDILVNLNGYHGDERTGVFSYKPSPIQVNYLGFTATMGVDYIDYIIADKYVIPPASKNFYTESVVHLPDIYQVNDTKRRIAERIPTRAEVKLPDTAFVFCCFNNNFKITPEIFDVWMRSAEEGRENCTVVDGR